MERSLKIRDHKITKIVDNDGTIFFRLDRYGCTDVYNYLVDAAKVIAEEQGHTNGLFVAGFTTAIEEIWLRLND